MNPLAELHDRLAYTAVAGTALLDEDFRLKKTIEVFAALAQKNPVFAKIHTGLTGLFEAAPAERGTQILNLLGLVDAVLYTQADYGIQGDLTPFSQNADEGHIRQIRYSALIPIVQALTEAGSGRMEVVRNALKEHPEYFADFRVVRALIENLSDTYSEMAAYSMRILQALATGQPMDLTSEWEEINIASLPQIDSKRLIALLKYNFNPASKTNIMKRRLMLICTIAGGTENDWYLSLLEQAGKELRPLVIFALGFREENIPLLLEFAQKERGKAEEMAYRALARWDTPEVLALFQQTMEKKPKLAAYLADTDSDFYGDFVAEHLQKALIQLVDQPHISREQMDETIDPWLCALKNKASDGVIALYRWCIQNENKIPKIQDPATKKQPKTYSMLPYLDRRIYETLMLRCPRKLTDFLQEENVQTEAGLLADLLTLPAAQVYEKWGETQKWIHTCLKDLSLMKSASGKEMLCVRSNIETGDPFASKAPFCYRPIKEPLDWRWIEFFIQEQLDQNLKMLDTETMPEAWKTRVGSYFYQQALKWEHWYRVSEQWFCNMERLGWKNYENILLGLCKLQSPFWSSSPITFILEVLAYYEKYAGQQAAVEEAQRVMDFYHDTKKDPLLEAELFEAFQAHGWLNET